MFLYLLYFCGISVYILFDSFGQSSFLGDQIDQIQSAEELWKGRIISLYGPYLSTTYPIVYPFGPITYLIISIFNSLNINFTFYQTGFGVINIISILFLVFEIKNHNQLIAKIFLLLIALSSVYHFSLSMLWNNVLIVSSSSLYFCFLLRFVRNHFLSDFLYLVLFLILGLHLHLIGIILIVPTIYIFLRIKYINSHAQRFWTLLGFFLILFSSFFYLFVEVVRKFKNTKYILFNSQSRLYDTYDLQNLWILLQKFLMPVEGIIWQAGLGILGVTLFIYFRIRIIQFTKDKNPFFFQKFIILECIVIAFLSELFFFLFTKQPIRSIHYEAYLTVFSIYILSFSFAYIIEMLMVQRIINMNHKAAHLVSFLCCAFFLFYFGYTYQNKFRSHWNFQNIVNSLNAICETNPKVNSFEMEYFRSPHSEFKPVLEFVIKKNRSKCIYDPNSDIVLVPEANTDPDSLLARYPLDFFPKKIRTVAPGIGIYQKLPLGKK